MLIMTCTHFNVQIKFLSTLCTSVSLWNIWTKCWFIWTLRSPRHLFKCKMFTDTSVCHSACRLLQGTGGLYCHPPPWLNMLRCGSRPSQWSCPWSLYHAALELETCCLSCSICTTLVSAVTCIFCKHHKAWSKTIISLLLQNKAFRCVELLNE